MVNMPGGAMLLEVEERDDDAVSILSRRDSLSGALTVGGVTALPDTAYFDKKIKIEMVSYHCMRLQKGHISDLSDIDQRRPVISYKCIKC